VEQLASVIQGFVSLVARLALMTIFLVSTVANKIPQFTQTVAYMGQEGVPIPKAALAGAIGLLLLGSLSLIVGAWTRIGAFFLLVFLCAATYYFHDFWTLADPLQRQLQTIQFLKNLSIAGGLLALMAFGGGPWSVDGWIDRRQAEVEAGPTQKPKVPAKPTAQA
jgi:putative oxidoreductase